MVTKKTTKSRAAPRRAAPAAKKKGRRVSTLNRSVKKPARAIGVAVGAMIPYAGSIVDSVKSKSIAPMSSAIMSKDNAVKAAKGAAVGFIAGTVAGMVVDKAGLKKPVNKILKSVKGLTGGIL
jgi:hypothetical protein